MLNELQPLQILQDLMDSRTNEGPLTTMKGAETPPVHQQSCWYEPRIIHLCYSVSKLCYISKQHMRMVLTFMQMPVCGH